MQQNIKDILNQVLTIIGYTDDKNAFVDEFMRICQKQALADLFHSLSVEKQTSLKEQTKSEEAQKTLEQYFTSKDINKTVAKAVQSQFISYLQTIDSTLTPEQRNNLDAFLGSLTSSQQSSQIS